MKELLKSIQDNNILLEVVDGELKVFAGESPVSSELITEIKDNKKELIRFLNTNNQVSFKDSFSLHIPKAKPAEAYPLSSSQYRLWILSQFEQGNIGYNIPGVCVLAGDFDYAAFSQAFAALIKRHEILRTIFRDDKQGEVRQVILPAEESGFTLDCADARNDGKSEEEIRDLIQAEFVKPFDLAAGPLLRAGLFRVKDDQWVFYYVMHHIISDGWSKSLLVKELMHYYSVYKNNEEPGLRPLRIQYKDYATWQQEQLTGEALREHRSYWMKQFEGEIPVVDLPSTLVRPAIKTYNGAAISKQIDPTIAKGIKSLSQRQGSTLFMGLLAAVNALFYRYSGQEDIVIGTPVAGRHHMDLEDQIGFYANTLALRTQFSGKNSFKELLKNVKQVAGAAYEYQLYPFDRLVNDLGLQRDMGRNPLFDIQVIVQGAERAKKEDEVVTVKQSLDVKEFPGAEKLTSVFDIVFNFVQLDQGFNVKIVYNTDVYNQEMIRQLGNHLEQMLAAILDQPDTPIDQLKFLSVKEIDQQINGFNNTAVEFPHEKNLISLFDNQVKKTPGHTAIVFGENSLTYRELDEKSNQLAAYLQSNYRISTGNIVGIMLDRSEKMLIAILGILKSGAAYVFIDPQYPVARKKYMIDDTAIEVLITQTEYVFGLDYFHHNVFAIDIQMDECAAAGSLRPIFLQPSDPAYVIYTSGSTGEPKGVVVGHGAVANSILAQQPIFDLQTGDRCLQFLSFSFDASIFEIFIALTSGASLYMIEEDNKKSADLLEKYIAANDISFASIPPAYLKLLKPASISALKKIVTGGDSLGVERTNAVSEHAIYYNAYGPTETAICASVFTLDKGQKITGKTVPVGKPLSNLRIYILDKENNLLPIGAAGEICIAGEGLANCYLNKPLLTDEKFVVDPFYQGEKMYRTGDLGRWLPDGNIEFAGRKDEQVKVRGYRIELGEIEQSVLGYPGVNAAVVTAMRNDYGENELIAYVVSNDTVNTANLKSWVEKGLPAYMIPAHVVQLEKLPLTSTGKLDKKQLPGPEGLQTETEYTAPRNEMDQKLVGVWKEILGRERIGITNSFFDLGGDSIKILRMTAAARNELGIEIQVADVYKYNTIETILDHLEKNKTQLGQRSVEIKGVENFVREEIDSLRQRIFSENLIDDKDNIEDIYPMSDIEIGMVYESLLHEGMGVYHDQMVRRRVIPDFNIERLRKALKLMVRKHSILRTGFNVSDYETEIQVVYKEVDCTFLYMDIAHLERSQQEKEIMEYLKAERQRPFRFAEPPLWRMTICKLGNDEIVFIFQSHHSILDGWSDASFTTELNNIYYELEKDPSFIPVPLKISGKDHIIQQHLDKRNSKTREFWQAELSDYTRLNLFTSENDVQSSSLLLDAAAYEQLGKAAANYNTTVKAISLSAYIYTLKLLSNEDEIVAGLVTNTRPNSEDGDKILGCFLNTIPFKLLADSHNTCQEFVSAVQQKLVELKDHERLSILEIAQIHNKQIDAGNAFFDVIFNFTDFHTYKSLVEDKEATRSLAAMPSMNVSGHGRTNTFLDVSVNVTGGRYVVNTRLNRKLRSGLSSRRLAELFLKVLHHITQSPSKAIHDFEIVSETEKQLLLDTYNNTYIPYPATTTLVDLFRNQAKITPAADAIVFGKTKITYNELDCLSNRMARYLRSNYGIQPNELVGIKLERSEWLVISILAVLKSGGAYVPVDPGYPADRIDYMIQDCACRVVIDQAELNRFKAKQKRYSYRNPKSIHTANDLAYVIYTSGSSGTPKGVMTEHAAAVNSIRAQQEILDIRKGERITQFTSSSFDVSFFEIFITICSGGALYIISEDIKKAPLMLETFLKEKKIDMASIPPAYLKLLQVDKLRSLKKLVTGGEAADMSQVIEYSAYGTYYNGYGPTESSVCATMFRLDRQTRITTSSIPIGRPISNVEIYITDDHQNLLPPGIAGEIYISGEGLSRGYLNNPGLTHERFITNPFRKGKKMYRTGDIGRWLRDGNIEFTGRKDEQVKIRGYRIEMGEIEKALTDHPAVDAAVVAAKLNTSGDKELVAYIISTGTMQIDELRLHLNRRLPAYMLPACFVQLDKLPVTSNGKVDRKKLPDPEGISLDAGLYEPPVTPSEQSLAGTWKEILGKERIGINDDFFARGGHSLLAMRMVSMVNRSMNANITIRDLYSYPTIRQLGALLDGIDENADVSNAVINLVKESYTGIDYGKAVGLPGHNDLPQDIFITGATGFVGAYLLKELLDTTNAVLYCLVRAKNEEEALQRIIDNLSYYKLYQASYGKRIIPVTGDLSMPRLGISNPMYAHLARKIDYIYHAGAHIDLIANYRQLKAANTTSSKDILGLAATEKLKKVIYISTLSVLSGKKTGIRYENDSIDEENHSYAEGYSGSKWVSEKMMIDAMENGMPVQIHRLGLVTGDNQTARIPDSQWLPKLLKLCVDIGAFPDGFNIPATPVDFVSKAIINLSFRNRHDTSVFHLINPSDVPLGDFFTNNQYNGPAVERSSIGEWLVKLRDSPNSSSSQIRAMIESSYRINDNTDYKNIQAMPAKKSHISTQLTMAALAEINISFPAVASYLPSYTNNLL